MKLTIVGCTGSMSGPEAPASSYLLQETDADGRQWSIVMDMGPGTFGSLWKFIQPEDVDAAFFSHWHADHCSDMLSMHIYRRWHPTKTFPTLPVWSPGGGLDRIRQLDGFDLDDPFTEFDFKDFRGCDSETPGESVVIGPFTVTPYEAYHTVPAVSLRVESAITSHVMTYTGDTDLCPGVRAAARNVTLLLSEAAFRDDDPCRGVHLSGGRAGELARDAHVEQMILTHIQPWTPSDIPLAEARAVYSGPLSIAQVGDTYTI